MKKKFKVVLKDDRVFLADKVMFCGCFAKLIGAVLIKSVYAETSNNRYVEKFVGVKIGNIAFSHSVISEIIEKEIDISGIEEQ